MGQLVSSITITLQLHCFGAITITITLLQDKSGSITITIMYRLGSQAQTIRFISYFQTSFKDTLLSVSLSHFLGPCPPMRPDSVLDLGAIEIILSLIHI